MPSPRNTQTIYAALVGVVEKAIIALNSKKRVFLAHINEKALLGGQIHASSSAHAERLA